MSAIFLPGAPSTVKATLAGDTRRLRLVPPVGGAASNAAAFAALEDTVRHGFRFADAEGLILKYTDDDGDLCTLAPSTMEDFVSLSHGNVWRLHVEKSTLPAQGGSLTIGPSPQAAATQVVPQETMDTPGGLHEAEASVVPKTEDSPRHGYDGCSSVDRVDGPPLATGVELQTPYVGSNQDSGSTDMLGAIAGFFAKGFGKGKLAMRPPVPQLRHSWETAGEGRQLGRSTNDEVPGEFDGISTHEQGAVSLAEIECRPASTVAAPVEAHNWDTAGPGQQLGSGAASDPSSSGERRMKAVQAAQQRQVSIPGISEDRAKELTERQQKDELLGKLAEHYNKQQLEMPMGLNAATAEQLRRHWEVVRRADPVAKVLGA